MTKKPVVVLDHQERNQMFQDVPPGAKTDFQVLKFKFYACNFKQAFYPLHKRYIA